MFEKHRNTKQDAGQGTGQSQASQDSFTASSNPPATSGRAAVIGPGIHINGDVIGSENLIVEGKVTGKIKLVSHQVDIGQSGQVKADITAKVIKIAGTVRGDLNGTEKVVISRSGNVHGNITAPRMTLEDGAIFKGSIDMDPGEPEKPVVAKPAVKKVAKKTEELTKPASRDKSKQSSAYTLNGG